MSKGSQRRPENAAAIARNWPFTNDSDVNVFDPARWTQEMRDDCVYNAAWSDAINRYVDRISEAIEPEAHPSAPPTQLAAREADRGAAQSLRDERL